MTGIVPKKISAGVNFTATLWRPEFSGATWTATIILRGPGVIDLEGTRDGARHVWDVAAAESASWTPGDYAFAVRVTDGDAVHEIESGRVRIMPNLAALSAGAETRSEARIALDAINAVLAKRATLDQERYRINNRELYRTPIAELLKLRAHYVELCRAEDAEAAGGRKLFGKQVKIRMGASS